VLTQTIDTRSAKYPITADPKFTWGWITGTVYFNKSETAEAAVAGGVAGFWSQFVPGWGTLLGAYSSTLAAEAGLARARGECLEVKLPAPVPGAYKGGYCK
jgi:hypothetical protein